MHLWLLMHNHLAVSSHAHTHARTHGRTPLCRWILTGQVYRLHCLHVDYVGTIVRMFRRCVKPPNEMLVSSSLQRKESEKCKKRSVFLYAFFFFCEREGCSSSSKWKKESRRGSRRQMRGEEQRTGGGEGKITTIEHQAEFHILNGNHGNNYRADRQAVFLEG